MQRGPNDSQIVNNLFTFATIVIVSVVLMIYTKYVVKKNESNRINSGLPCQEEVKTFDKVSNKTLFPKAYNLLEKGHYVLDGGIIESLDGDSVLIKKININQINNIFLNSIGINSVNNIQRFLKIKYELIEYDEQESGTGKLLTSFRLQNKEVFTVSMQFETFSPDEIKKRIDCTMEAFKYNAKR